MEDNPNFLFKYKIHSWILETIIKIIKSELSIA